MSFYWELIKAGRAVAGKIKKFGTTNGTSGRHGIGELRAEVQGSVCFVVEGVEKPARGWNQGSSMMARKPPLTEWVAGDSVCLWEDKS